MLETKNVSFSTLSSADPSLPEWKRVCMDEDGGAKILDMKQVRVLSVVLWYSCADNFL